ncbi:hypothetical protein [Pseudooceanicola batsensis]|nr:hypothetical protein [Pseudooceanicola batsensis]
MRVIATALLFALLPPPAVAQTCFDPSQCARDAIMTSRMVSREVSRLATELNTLRADRRALSADVAALREDLAALREALVEQADRLEAVEEENARLRGALDLPTASGED